MKKAALVISIISLSLSVITLALTAIELFYKKTSYIDSDNV